MKQTYTIKASDGKWYWHLSTPGRPGVQSDAFPTRKLAEKDVKLEYPDAVMFHDPEMQDIYDQIPDRYRLDFLAVLEGEEVPDDFWNKMKKDTVLRKLLEKALRSDKLGKILSDREVWQEVVLGKIPEQVNIDCRYVGTVLNNSQLENVARNICVMQKQTPKGWTPFTVKSYTQFCNDNREKDDQGKPCGGEVGSAELAYLDQLVERGFLTCKTALKKHKSYEVNEKFVAMLVLADLVS